MSNVESSNYSEVNYPEFASEFKTEWTKQKISSKETPFFEKLLVIIGLSIPSNELVSQAYNRYKSVRTVQWQKLYSEESLWERACDKLEGVAKRVFSKKSKKPSYEESENAYHLSKTAEFREKESNYMHETVVDDISYKVPDPFFKDMDRGFKIGDWQVPNGTSLEIVIRKMLELGLTKIQIDKVTHLFSQRMPAHSLGRVMLGSLSGLPMPIQNANECGIQLSNGDVTLYYKTKSEILTQTKQGVPSDSLGEATTSDTLHIDAKGRVSDLKSEYTLPERSIGIRQVLITVRRMIDKELSSDDEEFAKQYIQSLALNQELMEPEEKRLFLKLYKVLLSKLQKLGRQDLINALPKIG